MSLPGLHVLIVNGSLHGGGAEHVISTLARHLRALRHTVTIGVAHAGGEVMRELEADGFDIVSFGGSWRSAPAALARAVDERGIQILHSHDLRSLIDAGRCRLRRRTCAHVHTFHFGNYPSVSWKHWVMEAAAARVPDRLVAVGDAQRRTVVNTLRLPEARIHTIWNGVDHEGGAPDPAPPPADGRLCIGSVCAFFEQKGLPTLLAAASQLRERGLRFRLVLVGEGPLRAELEALVRSLDLSDCVEFTGWRPDAARTLMPTFDIFVQSSYWEAMSVVVLEAMAARRPIVATAVGENAAVLSPDMAGIVVPPRDATALADGLARVLTDVTLRARLADNAYATYMKCFTARTMADRYETTYRECLAVRRPERP